MSTAAAYRQKVQAAALTSSQYLDRHLHFAKADADVHLVRVLFADGTTLELPVVEYERLSGTERAAIRDAGLSVSVVDERDGRY